MVPIASFRLEALPEGRSGSVASILRYSSRACFHLNSGAMADIVALRVWANSGHCRMSGPIAFSRVDHQHQALRETKRRAPRVLVTSSSAHGRERFSCRPRALVKNKVPGPFGRNPAPLKICQSSASCYKTVGFDFQQGQWSLKSRMPLCLHDRAGAPRTRACEPLSVGQKSRPAMIFRQSDHCP